MNRAEIYIETGSVGILRLYDIAYSIDLSAAEAILEEDATVAAHRRRLTHAEPKAIAFDVPPVQLALGPIEAPVAGQITRGQAFARVYDFGVISIHLRFLAEGIGWLELTRMANELDEWASSADARRTWEMLKDETTALIRPALLRPTYSELEEDYLLVTINQLDQPLEAEEFLERVDPIPILTGDLQPLSPGARADLLRHTYSYFINDLAILSWDRALIYEPTPDSDVADVLEVANAQLLELSHYDDRLNAEIPQIYDRVAKARVGLRSLTRSPYADLARDLYTFVAEITETLEKVDNALKVTEDVYIARVYNAALDLFRVRTRAANVDRKLEIIRDTYQALYDEAATARSELLTIAIIILIALEILLTLAWW